MRLAAAESLLLAGLLLLSAYGLWDFLSTEVVQQSAWAEALAERFPDYASRELALAVPLCVAAYWGLHALGANSLVFWSMALLIILPQGPAIWAHNQIEWFNFFGVEAGLEVADPQLRQATLFLGSLVGLVALYRTISLRRLDQQLASQDADAADRRRIVLFEALMLGGLITAGLSLAFLMVLVANVLGRLDPLLDWSPWGVLSIGAAATVLLLLTVMLWFRSREGPDTLTPEPSKDPIARPRARRARPRRQTN